MLSQKKRNNEKKTTYLGSKDAKAIQTLETQFEELTAVVRKDRVRSIMQWGFI